MCLPCHPDSGDPWACALEVPVATVSLLEVGVHRLRQEHALDHAQHSVVRALSSRNSHRSPRLRVRRGRWQQRHSALVPAGEHLPVRLSAPPAVRWRGAV